MSDMVWLESSWGLFLYFRIFSAIFSLNTSFIFSKFSSLNMGVVWLRKGRFVIILMTRLCIFPAVPGQLLMQLPML